MRRSQYSGTCGTAVGRAAEALDQRARSHGLFLKLLGIFTTKDTKSTKFNKSDSFGYFQRPTT